MIPTIYTPVKALPRTESGKMNSQSLAPANPWSIPSPQSTVKSPRTSTEHDLVNIWREVLRVKQVGIEDNFLDAGGDSLSAMQILSRIRAQFGVDISVRDFFDRATIVAIALIDAEMVAALRPTGEQA